MWIAGIGLNCVNISSHFCKSNLNEFFQNPHEVQTIIVRERTESSAIPMKQSAMSFSAALTASTLKQSVKVVCTLKKSQELVSGRKLPVVKIVRNRRRSLKTVLFVREMWTRTMRLDRLSPILITSTLPTVKSSTFAWTESSLESSSVMMARFSTMKLRNAIHLQECRDVKIGLLTSPRIPNRLDFFQA